MAVVASRKGPSPRRQQIVIRSRDVTIRSRDHGCRPARHHRHWLPGLSSDDEDDDDDDLLISEITDLL